MSTSAPSRPVSVAERRARLVALSETFPTQKAFSEALGLGESRLSKALSGVSVTERKLLPVEHAVSERNLWTRLSESDGGEGGPPEVSSDSATETVADATGIILGRQAVRVPYYGRVGAGPPRVPIEAVGHIDVTEAEYAADFAASPRQTKGGLVAAGRYGYFTVDGDSAAPVFFDGERVPVEVLDVPTDTFTQDTVCVFRWDDGQMLKRLRRLPGGRIEAHALNPGIEPFRFHPGDDSETFAVLAVARVSQKQQLYTALVSRFLRTDG